MLMYGLLFTLITWVKNTRLGEKWRGHPRRGYLLTFIKVLIASAAPDYPVVVLTYFQICCLAGLSVSIDLF